MSAHPVDSAVYGHLWSTPELHALLDDRGRVQGWLEILAALAEAQADLGLIPADAAVAIRAAARAELIDLDRLAAETRASGHSTLGLVRCLRAVLPAHAGEWVYWGATVQDLTDTWTAVVARRVGDILARDLGRCELAAVGLARAHRDTIMCGRTHGQPGLPTTFGLKAAVWASELGRHLDRLAEGRRRWEVAQLGGALGTMEFWGDAALPLLAGFAARLGLGVPDAPWLTARDRIAELAGLLAMVTATLGKVGNEVYQLQRPEIGELREPASPGQVGSITMPHKRNPELSEHLGTLARLVRAQAGVAVEGMVHEHERDGRAWKAEWVLLPEAFLLSGAALGVAARLLEGLEVDPARMRANLDALGGYLASEPVMRALADRVGKHTAQELVYRAAMAGQARGVGLRAAIEADRELAAHLDPAELERLLDPANALGAAGAFVDRVVAGARTPGTGTAEPGTARPAAARVPLAALPTPLQPAPGLSAELGSPVWLKRDDLTGLGLGGNKVRALEYLLGEAEAAGADCLVTGGGPQSNWAALAALAARRRGLDTFLVAYGPPRPVTGNLLLAELAGAGISFTGDPDRASVDAGVAAAAERLAAAGRRPHQIPRGGATAVGAVGYAVAAAELAGQLSAAGVVPVELWLATGSCATQAGLVAGWRANALPGRVVGVTVSRPRPECLGRVASMAAGAGRLLGAAPAAAAAPVVDEVDGVDRVDRVDRVDAAGVPADVVVLDGHIGPGYGLPSPAGALAARLTARREGVLLDPVFGAKAMGALLAAGPRPGPVVFLVSGGAPTLFAGAGA